MNPIYLDNNATTRIDPRVAEAMHQCYLAGCANPASQHQPGQKCRRILERARETVAQTLGCQVCDLHPDQVIFTSGGTEANNLAILGLTGREPGRVIISAIEHSSVAGPALRLRNLGFDVQTIRVSADGVVDRDHFSALFTPQTRLVSVMLGNNETGVLQPVREIAALCRNAGVPIHTDAVQVVGKLPVRLRDLGVTALSVGAHKFHGPCGIGALLVHQGTKLEPLLTGGLQQHGLRPGTEPVALAVGLEKALSLWAAEAYDRAERLTRLRTRLEQGLVGELPDVVINGSKAPRLPHTANVAFPGVDRQALLMALDVAGIACATGSACASGSTEPSPVLQAMGLPAEIINSSLRFGLGADTTDREIDEAVCRISRAVRELRR
jgi:cysteine desulfurase